MGETMMRITEVINKQRTQLTAQERERVARKKGSEICFLTHTEEACHWPTSLCGLRFQLNAECF